MCSAPCVHHSGSPADPFSVHIEFDLTDEEVGSLKEALSQPLHYQHTAVGALVYRPIGSSLSHLLAPPPSILCWAQLVMLSVYLKEILVLPLRSSLWQNIM